MIESANFNIKSPRPVFQPTHFEYEGSELNKMADDIKTSIQPQIEELKQLNNTTIVMSKHADKSSKTSTVLSVIALIISIASLAINLLLLIL